MNETCTVVESSAYYSLIKLRLGRVIKYVHDFSRLELDPSENLWYYTQVD